MIADNQKAYMKHCHHTLRYVHFKLELMLKYAIILYIFINAYRLNSAHYQM